MIVIRVEFLAGSFHATPWDKAVNEGEVEWPPSPWRLLRALLAGWHLLGEVDTTELSGLLDKLALPPRFLLPPWTAGHTRHFMPQGTVKKDGSLATALVLDAFVAFHDRNARAFIVWDDVTVSGDGLRLLKRICSVIGYLGRAESWCRLSVDDGFPSDPDFQEVLVAGDLRTGGMLVRRLSARTELRGVSLLRALNTATRSMRNAGRLTPRGTEWIEYLIPPSAPLGSTAPHDDPELMPRTVLRFVLEGPTEGLRPKITDALLVGELMRAAAMSTYKKLYGQSIPMMLSGKEPDGAPAVGHRHAFFLARDLDGDGKIDHIDIRLPVDYSHRVHRALLSVSRVWGRPLGLPLDQQYAITKLGDAPRESGRAWRSATPFVLERHPHIRGAAGMKTVRDAPEDQIRRSLDKHGIVGNVKIEFDETIWQRSGRPPRPDEFRRSRRSDKNVAAAFSARLYFEEPQSGPITIGRHCHFGLGRFEPAD